MQLAMLDSAVEGDAVLELGSRCAEAGYKLCREAMLRASDRRRGREASSEDERVGCDARAEFETLRLRVSLGSCELFLFREFTTGRLMKQLALHIWLRSATTKYSIARSCKIKHRNMQKARQSSCSCCSLEHCPYSVRIALIQSFV